MSDAIQAKTRYFFAVIREQGNGGDNKSFVRMVATGVADARTQLADMIKCMYGAIPKAGSNDFLVHDGLVVVRPSTPVEIGEATYNELAAVGI